MIFAMKESVSRRRFASTVASSVAVGNFASSVNAARSNPNQTQKVEEILQSWIRQHGSVDSVDGKALNESKNRYLQILRFEDGTIRTFEIQYISETQAKVEINSEEYDIMGEPIDSAEKSRIQSSIPEFGEGADSSPETDSIPPSYLSDGEEIFRTSAEDYKYSGSGGGAGTRKHDHNLSGFRAEVVTSGAGAFYGKDTTDIYFEVFIDEPSSETFQLEADFDVDWEISTMAAGGTADCWGHCKIRDIANNENLVNSQVYNRSKKLVGVPRRYTDSAQPTIGHQVQGQKWYRIGIRAYTEAEAWLTAWSTADTYTGSGENKGEFFDVNSVSVSLE